MVMASLSVRLEGVRAALRLLEVGRGVFWQLDDARCLLGAWRWRLYECEWPSNGRTALLVMGEGSRSHIEEISINGADYLGLLDGLVAHVSSLEETVALVALEQVV